MDLPLNGVRHRSRLAGIFYLVTIATGLFAEVFVREAVMVRDDPAATAANMVTLLFLDLFQPVTKSVSLLAAVFSMVGIAVLEPAATGSHSPLC